MEDEEDQDEAPPPEDEGPAEEARTDRDREILSGAASDAIAQMPGYDKLGNDQDAMLYMIEDRPPYPWSSQEVRAVLEKAGINEGKLGCFPSRADYLAWAHRLFVHSLGRKPKYRRILFSQLLLPFMVEGERGATPGAVVIRQHLRAYITEDMFPGAQAQYSRKAREEPLIEVRYLERGRASSSVYDRLAERKAETERREVEARGKR